MAGWIKIPLGMEVGLGPGNFVFDGDPSPPEKPHPILASVCCGQMARWIKMPLDTEVNLGPGNVVLAGVAGLPPKRGITPSFQLMSIVAKRLDG